MNSLVFDFPTSSPLGDEIRELMGADKGKVVLRYFPDGETYLRVESHVKNRDVIINTSLFHPNDMFLNLFFLADTLRLQGAKTIGLLAPYLAYMRQDKVFLPGEALTSVTFAKLLSQYFSYLITVEPHLHRYHSLAEIYSIPTIVVKAAPLITKWIRKNVTDPFLIGPDEESNQWVKEIAAEFPYIILKKIRHKDGRVEITWPEIGNLKNKVPVLVDDIISSGETMFQAVQYLKNHGMKAPFCIVIHPIFGRESYQKLQTMGVKAIVSCNSIPHPSNQIDLSPLLAREIIKFLRINA